MLTVTCAEVLQRIRDMEGSRPSKRAAAAGSDGQGSVCYGVGVDGKREHQPVCGSALGCEQVRTCRLPPTLLSSSIVDDYVDPIVGGRREGFGLYARSRNGPRGPQGGAS